MVRLLIKGDDGEQHPFKFLSRIFQINTISCGHLVKVFIHILCIFTEFLIFAIELVEILGAMAVQKGTDGLSRSTAPGF